MVWEKFQDLNVRGRQWFAARAHGPHAKAWLFALSFTESSFFLIPPDVLVIAVLMVESSRWVYYALLTTIGSVLGGIFGYFVGAFLFDLLGSHIIAFYHLEAQFETVKMLFERSSFLVVFTAAFTPIPFKLFVLAAGFLKSNLLAFFIAALLGRGMRFFLVAYLVRVFGDAFTPLLFRYFSLIT